jgi:hypothetical protein
MHLRSPSRGLVHLRASGLVSRAPSRLLPSPLPSRPPSPPKRTSRFPSRRSTQVAPASSFTFPPASPSTKRTAASSTTAGRRQRLRTSSGPKQEFHVCPGVPWVPLRSRVICGRVMWKLVAAHTTGAEWAHKSRGFRICDHLAVITSGTRCRDVVAAVMHDVSRATGRALLPAAAVGGDLGWREGAVGARELATQAP